MYLRTRFKARKSRTDSRFQAVTSLFYALLCVALAGFFVWVWRGPGHGGQTAPVTTPAPPTKQVTPPVAINRPQIPEATSSETRPVENILEAQIALVEQGISPGSIDGVEGSQTDAALAAFQKKRGIVVSGVLDAHTKALLLISQPAMTEYAVTSEDLGRIMPLPKTWLGKSGQTRLDFETIPELLGEKAFSSPQLIRTLNPGVNWSQVTNGTKVTIPRVDYPPVTGKAAFVKISLQQCALEVFDSQTNILAHFPCSIGRVAARRPAGELHVTDIVLDPNYTFDPALFPESPEAQTVGRKLILPPGPNNPVGVAWIGLDRPGYGIHGTPAPEQVGRTESHGCFRLANWNASYLASQVWVGMTVIVE
ncbi:MAG TPA: L,D-transpeptidase [Candidatus Baltobacteraceae bacterium]|nr:L,D-transpeptidase [Candidatus Baltobacteraceae bacterium]